MSWVTFFVVVLLPTIGMVLGGGLGLLSAASSLAAQRGISWPQALQLLIGRFSQLLRGPDRGAEAAETDDRLWPDPVVVWACRWLGSKILRRQEPAPPFPVRAFARRTLEAIALSWAGLLLYVLIVNR